MSQKVKSIVYYLDNYEWINILSLIILVGTSIGLFFNHGTPILELGIIIGLIAILKGFLNFNLFLSVDLSTKKKQSALAFIIAAFGNIGIGLVLILNIFINPVELLVLTVIWMLLEAVPYAYFIQKNKLGTQYKYNPFIVNYLLIFLTIIFTGLAISFPLFSPAVTVGLFLCLSSINLLLLNNERKTL